MIFNASIDVFPDAEIVQYARGSVSYSDTYGWVGKSQSIYIKFSYNSIINTLGPPSCDTCDKYWGHYTTWDLGCLSLDVHTVSLFIIFLQGLPSELLFIQVLQSHED